MNEFEIEKEICFVYHRLAIAGFFDISELHSWKADLPYWEYFNCRSQWEEDQHFVQNGCLILVLCLALGTEYDFKVIHDGDKCERILKALGELRDRNEAHSRLIKLTRTHVELAKKQKENPKDPEAIAIGNSKENQDERKWAFKTFVTGYFKSKETESGGS